MLRGLEVFMKIYTVFVTVILCVGAFWSWRTTVETNQLIGENYNYMQAQIDKLQNKLVEAKAQNNALKLELDTKSSMAESTLSVNNIQENEKVFSCQVLSEKIESGFYDEAYRLYQEATGQIASDEIPQRNKSIKALAQLEIPEAEESLIQILNDQDEDTQLRSEVARAMNWGDKIEKATEILTNDEEDDIVKSALILGIGDNPIMESENGDFENTVMGVFNEKSSAFLQIAAADYIANNHPEMLKQIVVNSGDEEVSKEVTQHLMMLQK
jgi:hypothetical protein